MPIREWHEEIRISVECDDRNLPQAIAAISGQYTGSEITYIVRDTETTFLLPNQSSRLFSRNGTRERDHA